MMDQTALNLIGKITDESPEEIQRHEALIALKPQAKELFDLLPTLKGATLNKMIALARGDKSIQSDIEDELRSVTGVQAARLLGVSRATLWRMVKAGNIKTVTPHKKSRILRSSITEFVRKQKVA